MATLDFFAEQDCAAKKGSRRPAKESYSTEAKARAQHPSAVLLNLRSPKSTPSSPEAPAKSPSSLPQPHPTPAAPCLALAARRIQSRQADPEYSAPLAHSAPARQALRSHACSG